MLKDKREQHTPARSFTVSAPKVGQSSVDRFYVTAARRDAGTVKLLQVYFGRPTPPWGFSFWESPYEGGRVSHQVNNRNAQCAGEFPGGGRMQRRAALYS